MNFLRFKQPQPPGNVPMQPNMQFFGPPPNPQAPQGMNMPGPPQQLPNMRNQPPGPPQPVSLELKIQLTTMNKLFFLFVILNRECIHLQTRRISMGHIMDR